jgi:pilus assembly protein Flp/PilA
MTDAGADEKVKEPKNVARSKSHTGTSLMQRIHDVIRTFAGWFWVDSERAATAIQYGLVASLIALAIIVGATAVGVNLNALFNFVAGKVTAPTH